jgi:hypothetical protein
MSRNRILMVLGSVALCCAPSLWAQCTAVTSDGTAAANQVSKFTTDCNIEPSAITETNGNVGIGKVPSTYKLDVGGSAVVRGLGLTVSPSFNKITFPAAYIDGCSNGYGTFTSITFNANTNSCSGFSLTQASGTTFVSAPTEVSIILGGNLSAPIASFDNNGSTFHTDVTVSGSLSVSGSKNFKIDDPLDPANKYMYHASVESSEVMNMYTGNVSTDERGDAVVQLPAWFEALNRDFRYQLTVIGQFAQAIVAGKVANHSFRIKTDKPNVEVSWQVTGIRQDAYAKAHPLVVEEDKPVAERGYYLHPEVFGQPGAKGINYARQFPAREKQRELAKEERAGN